MPRTRRYTLHSAAVLTQVNTRPQHQWSTKEVAEKTGLVDGTAYTILQRFFLNGLVARLESGDESHAPGEPWVWYQITPRGAHKAKDILAARHPVQMLRAWQVDDDDEDA